MQIIESSAFGVRAAIYRFEHSDSALQFELFPMIHIAERQFYDSVRTRLSECDLVLFEGISSARVWALATSYTLTARRKRLGLVCQREALPRSSIQSRLFHADISAREFDEVWRRVPLWQRLLFFIAAPLQGAWGYLTATRESVARRCGTDDLKSRDDVLEDEDLEEVRDAISTRRDSHLLSCVLKCHDENASTSCRAAVLYGAAHMPAVVRLLQDRLGYRVTRADWLTVLEL